jgi:hypothetical protein
MTKTRERDWGLGYTDVPMISRIGLPELLTIYALMFPFVIVVVIPLCVISRRIGRSWGLGLLSLIPFFGLLIWAYYVAFSRWPVNSTRSTSSM